MLDSFQSQSSFSQPPDGTDELQHVPADETASSVEPTDDRPENEIMEDEDNTPEQRTWRKEWIDEYEDIKRTKSMSYEVNDKVKYLSLKGNVEIRDLSCRETVCRMYLQFENEQDAKQFIFAGHDPEFKFEYQLLNPRPWGVEQSPESKYNYEVLVKRERPEDLQKSTRPLTNESTNTTMSVSSEG